MISYGVVAALVLLVALVYAWWDHRDGVKEEAAAREAEDVAALGDEIVPPTIHPEIDPSRCIGSGACVEACPEHNSPIGLVQGRAQLVNPLSCIGHGACEAACPAGAIRLVFGTKTRGVELPRIDRNFETNQPGMYIAGELGGMGLIRNAVMQGTEAGAHVIDPGPARAPRRGIEGALDAVVIGAGPAGISATLKLMEGGLRVLLLDRETLGGTVTHYPRAKVVMTGDLNFPLFGRVKKRTMSKEALVDIWEQIQTKCNLPFMGGQLVQGIEAAPNGMWVVRTETTEYRAANVVLALGVRGSPRKLGVPGEQLPKVSYRLLEPAEFVGKHVLVVGGGNSAVETALACSDFGKCASVGISYRREQFARCRAENRRRIDEAIQLGKVTAFLPSEIAAIDPEGVTLKGGRGSAPITLRNDAVIAQIGGTAPSDLLKKFGVELVTKFAER